MKISIISFFAALSLALAFTGCTNVRVANEGKNMVAVDNSGFFFFGIPLFTGDPDYPNEEVCSWFTNTIKVETNIRLLEEEAARQGARGITNIVTYPDDEDILGFVFKRRLLRTSAELVK